MIFDIIREIFHNIINPNGLDPLPIPPGPVGGAFSNAYSTAFDR